MLNTEDTEGTEVIVGAVAWVLINRTLITLIGLIGADRGLDCYCLLSAQHRGHGGHGGDSGRCGVGAYKWNADNTDRADRR